MYKASHAVMAIVRPVVLARCSRNLFLPTDHPHHLYESILKRTQHQCNISATNFEAYLNPHPKMFLFPRLLFCQHMPPPSIVDIEFGLDHYRVNEILF